MILSRFTRALKRQDWATVTVEFLLVVAGVFIALQVDNWNQEREARQRELAILERLAADFAELERSGQDGIRFHEAALDGMIAVVQSLRNGAIAPENEERFRRGLRYAFTYQTALRESATLKELISSGELGLVSNVVLRQALIVYDGTLKRLDEAVSGTSQFQAQFLPDFTAHFRYDLERQFPSELKGAAQYSDIASYDFNAMLEDPTFRTAADQMREFQRFFLHYNRFMIRPIQDIRAQLAGELGNNGEKDA